MHVAHCACPIQLIQYSQLPVLYREWSQNKNSARTTGTFHAVSSLCVAHSPSASRPFSFPVTFRVKNCHQPPAKWTISQFLLWVDKSVFSISMGFKSLTVGDLNHHTASFAYFNPSTVTFGTLYITHSYFQCSITFRGDFFIFQTAQLMSA